MILMKGLFHRRNLFMEKDGNRSETRRKIISIYTFILFTPILQVIILIICVCHQSLTGSSTCVISDIYIYIPTYI